MILIYIKAFFNKGFSHGFEKKYVLRTGKSGPFKTLYLTQTHFPLSFIFNRFLKKKNMNYLSLDLTQTPINPSFS